MPAKRLRACYCRYRAAGNFKTGSRTFWIWAKSFLFEFSLSLIFLAPQLSLDWMGALIGVSIDWLLGSGREKWKTHCAKYILFFLASMDWLAISIYKNRVNWGIVRILLSAGPSHNCTWQILFSSGGWKSLQFVGARGYVEVSDQLNRIDCSWSDRQCVCWDAILND